MEEVDFDTTTLRVDHVYYEEYRAKSGNLTLKVTYSCEGKMFNEYLGFETHGMLRSRANVWWSQRSKEPMPNTVKEALAQVHDLKKPVAVNVRLSEKYPEITSVIF